MAGAHYCDMGINLGASDGWVEISGVGWSQGGSTWLPEGATFKYRLWNKPKAIVGPWKTVSVSCSMTLSVEVEFCQMSVSLTNPADGWIEISGVGWFQNGDPAVWLPKGATVGYRVWNAAKSAVVSGWANHDVTDAGGNCQDLVHP